MPAAAELAVGEDFALDFVALLGQDLHLDGPVVHQYCVSHVDIVHEFGVVDVHGIDFLALGAADGEGEFLARPQVERHAEVPGANGGPLGVHQNSDAEVAGGGGGANVFYDAANPLVGGVGHIQPEDIEAAVHEAADHFRGIRGRAERGDDFRAAHDVHPAREAGSGADDSGEWGRRKEKTGRGAGKRDQARKCACQTRRAALTMRPILWLTLQIVTRKTPPGNFTLIISALTATCAEKRRPITSNGTKTAATLSCTNNPPRPRRKPAARKPWKAVRWRPSAITATPP